MTLTRGERRRVARIRDHLKEAGIPHDVAVSLALTWFNATKIVEEYTCLASDKERFEKFPRQGCR